MEHVVFISLATFAQQMYYSIPKKCSHRILWQTIWKR